MKPPLERRGALSERRATSRFAAVGSPVARLLLIPHKVSSLRCGTLRGPRIRVVKMRRRSLRSSFLRNYREALSFSLRVDTSGQERRTEGIAIVTRSVNRVIPPPRGPRVGGGNQDNPRTNSLIERARTRRTAFHPVPLCPAASLFNASIRVDIFTPSPFVSEQQHRSVSPQNAKIFSVMRKKRANRLRASTFYAIITKQTRYALMVKRLRRRPLTAESGVRFPMRVPIKKHRDFGVF